MAKSEANLADYAIMVEPLSDADGGDAQLAEHSGLG